MDSHKIPWFQTTNQSLTIINHYITIIIKPSLTTCESPTSSSNLKVGNSQVQLTPRILLGISSPPCCEPRQQRALHQGGVLCHVLPTNVVGKTPQWDLQWDVNRDIMAYVTNNLILVDLKKWEIPINGNLNEKMMIHNSNSSWFREFSHHVIESHMSHGHVTWLVFS